MTVVLPPMADAQAEGWSAILDLHETCPTGWTLVGGQMVHLHCAERRAPVMRPTDDLDLVLDVRAEPAALLSVTTALVERGFSSQGETWNGHHHRWVRGQASIDVLIPRWLGERAAGRKGASGGTTLETPGAQQALDRTEEVAVDLADRTGSVRRPNLLGALVAKAAAHTITLDRARQRHRIDFVVLTTLIGPTDMIETASKRDRHYLMAMIGAVEADRRTLLGVEGARDGVDVLRMLLDG